MGLLGADPARAAEQFNAFRLKLTWFVEARLKIKGLSEDIVDETIERISEKILQGEKIENIYAYSRAVAFNVIKEYWDKLKTDPIPLDDLTASVTPDHHAQEHLEAERKELADNCKRKCLASLPKKQHDLIVTYYQAGRRSKDYKDELARVSGLNRDALCNRISRIKKKLSDCLEQCMQQAERLKTI